MFNFLKKLFEKKIEVRNNGTPITENEEFEFQKQLQQIQNKNLDERSVWLKYMFHLVLKRIFADMDEETKSSFLTNVKVKYHKDTDYGFNSKGDFIRTIDKYTKIERKRDIENSIKIDKILLPASTAYGVRGEMVYSDMYFISLVETNTNKDESKRKCVVYKTPVRLYMIVDDDFVSMKTKDGLISYTSIGFVRFGIILPEFASLNLQTKSMKEPYFLHEIQYNRYPKTNVSRLSILKKRIISDKRLDTYISTQEIVADKKDNPFKEIFSKEDIFLNKCEEFNHLFGLILNAQNTIFKIKENELFSTWGSCEKM